MKKTPSIKRHEEQLQHLTNWDAIDLESAAILPENLPRRITDHLRKYGLVDRMLQHEKHKIGRPYYIYWITERGAKYFAAIDSGDLLDESKWLQDIDLFKHYVAYGDEQYSIQFMLAHMCDDSEIGRYCFDALLRANHPSGLGARIGVATGGNAKNLPATINLETNGYRYKGAQLSDYAQQSLKRLMRLHEKTIMKKHMDANTGTISSILEFAIVYTLTHFDTISDEIGNRDDT